MDDDGIRVRFAYSKSRVPYVEIEKFRIGTIDRLFDRPEHSRMRTRAVKILGDQRALCFHLRDGEDNLPAVLRHKLGPRLVLDRELVMPITEIDTDFAAVRSRFSSRGSVAADDIDGGGRRRRRCRSDHRARHRPAAPSHHARGRAPATPSSRVRCGP